jgi:ATP-binding cassette, subfamily G (WHITE), member 2, PDR
MNPPQGLTCGQYLGPYAKAAGGRVYNPDANALCEYCSITVADQYLAGSAISYSTRWRNYGIVFSFIVFNICMAVLLYYLIRVRKGSGRTMGERFGWVLKLFRKDADAEKNSTDARAQEPQVKTDNTQPVAEDNKQEK